MRRWVFIQAKAIRQLVVPAVQSVIQGECSFVRL